MSHADLIGIGMDKAVLTAMLDSALLTDEEFAVGPNGWSVLPDPFESSDEIAGSRG